MNSKDVYLVCEGFTEFQKCVICFSIESIDNKIHETFGSLSRFRALALSHAIERVQTFAGQTLSPPVAGEIRLSLAVKFLSPETGVSMLKTYF